MQLSVVCGLVALCWRPAPSGRRSTASGVPAEYVGTSAAYRRSPQAARTARASSPGRSSTPSASCDGGFRSAPFGEDSKMTALQIFFNSLRSRTIVRAIWMPVLIGILLIGSCTPSNHRTMRSAKPQMLTQPAAKQSANAIIRPRAQGAGKRMTQPVAVTETGARINATR